MIIIYFRGLYFLIDCFLAGFIAYLVTLLIFWWVSRRKGKGKKVHYSFEQDFYDFFGRDFPENHKMRGGDLKTGRFLKENIHPRKGYLVNDQKLESYIKKWCRHGEKE